MQKICKFHSLTKKVIVSIANWKYNRCLFHALFAVQKKIVPFNQPKKNISAYSNEKYKGLVLLTYFYTDVCLIKHLHVKDETNVSSKYGCSVFVLIDVLVVSETLCGPRDYLIHIYVYIV